MDHRVKVSPDQEKASTAPGFASLVFAGLICAGPDVLTPPAESQPSSFHEFGSLSWLIHPSWSSQQKDTADDYVVDL